MNAVTNFLVSIIGALPEPVIWRFARRYIAGSTIEHGIKVMKELYGKGINATMDILGEDTTNEQEADAAMKDYLSLVAAIVDAGTKENISIKLTQMGLKIDVAKTAERVEKIARTAHENGLFFRIDIEDSSTTDDTLNLYRDLRKKIPMVGCALQAYLKRSLDDIRMLTDEGPTNLRLCKGIYVEPSAIAFKRKDDIRNNFIKMIRLMMDRQAYVAIATHDPWVIEASLQEIKKRNLAKDLYEFQMLYGVGESIRDRLVEEGHKVRVYIPFGVSWKAYSLRRFKENPKLAWYVIKNLFSPP